MMSTTTDRLARFETAQETIGLMIATLARKLHEARGVALPDADLEARLLSEMNRLEDEREGLRFDGTPTSNASIEHVLAEYGPLVKAAYAR